MKQPMISAPALDEPSVTCTRCSGPVDMDALEAPVIEVEEAGLTVDLAPLCSACVPLVTAEGYAPCRGCTILTKQRLGEQAYCLYCQGFIADTRGKPV